MSFSYGCVVQKRGQKEENAERNSFVHKSCDGNDNWDSLERKLLDVAKDVCGYTKDKLRHFERWWWNRDVNVAIYRKRELFRV